MHWWSDSHSAVRLIWVELLDLVHAFCVFIAFIDAALWFKCVTTEKPPCLSCNRAELLQTHRAQHESRAPLLCRRVVLFILTAGPCESKWLCSDHLHGACLTPWPPPSHCQHRAQDELAPSAQGSFHQLRLSKITTISRLSRLVERQERVKCQVMISALIAFRAS